jgi:8-amino-7-oxononanoate synthase
MGDAWHELFDRQLAQLHEAHRFRRRQIARPIDATRVVVGGHTLVNFASNDYLGLAHHPRVMAAFSRAAADYGVGSGAAPLITGYTDAHAAAEETLARWKSTQRAVLFPSGFQANLAIVQALATAAARGGCAARFLLDKLCHASLVDAARASAANLGSAGTSHYRVFPHNGIQKLATLLARGETNADADTPSADTPPTRDAILTESIFSMDGDRADLPAIVELKRRHGALLVLDEAHGSGVYGEAGAGLAAELGLSGDVDATIVTLSKAAGVIGAAVCGSAALCDVLVNLGRPYIFSTSVPAAVAAAAAESIAVMRDEPDRQRRVRQLAAYVRRRLTDAGFDLPPGDSPILPICLGDEAAALTAAGRLAEQGVYVLAIRPPTVAVGTSRLRITLSAEHADAQVEHLCDALVRTAAPR